MESGRSGRHGPYRYCASFCEENVWQLCGDGQLPEGPRAVVVVSNRNRTVAVAHQRAEVAPGVPVVWDYHVVMALRAGRAWQIWDLDSTLTLGVPLRRWLDESFGGDGGFGDAYAPLFRVVDAASYRAGLCSDRSHMPAADQRRPTWPRIGAGPPNLMRWVSMAPGFLGEVVARQDVPAALGRCVPA